MHATPGKVSMPAAPLCLRLSLMAVFLLQVFVTRGPATATPANNFNTVGLAAAYEFSGNAHDSSGNENHGVVHGATLTTDRFGNANSAYLFDGGADRIELSPIFSGDQDPLTFSVWVKIEEFGGSIYGEYTYYGQTRNFFKSYATGLTFDQYSPSGGGVGINVDLASHLHEWAHIALTKDSNLVSGYLNGVLIGSAVHTETYSGPGSTMAAIGNRFNYFNGGWADTDFDGSIDDLYIYNRALSPSEIATLAAIPEPSTALLLGIGLIGLSIHRRIL